MNRLLRQMFCAEFNPICRKSHKLVIVRDNKLLCTHKMDHSDKPIVKLTVFNKILNCLIDSGSDRTIIKSEICQKLILMLKLLKALSVCGKSMGKSSVLGETPFQFRFQF